LRDELSESEGVGWEFLASRETVTPREYAVGVGVADITARRHLRHFVTLGLLVREGGGRSTRYRVVRRPTT
jgi:Fic family protein